MAINTISASEITSFGFIPEIWAGSILNVLRASTPLASKISKSTDYSNSFVKGNVLNIPYPGVLSSNLKADDSMAILSQPVGAKEYQVTLNKFRYTDILLEDLAQVQSSFDLVTGYSTSIAKSLAEGLENDIYSTCFGSVTSSVGMPGSPITGQTFAQAKATLDAKLCPQADRTIVLSPQGTLDIYTDTNLQYYMALSASESIKTGVPPYIFGFETIESQLLQYNTSTGISQVQTISSSATGGTFKIKSGSSTSASLPWNVSLTALQTAIAGLAYYNSTANITVTGTPGSSYVITGVGVFSGEALNPLILDTTSLTGGTATIIVSTQGQTIGMAFEKSAFVLATRKLSSVPSTGVSSTTIQDEISGLTFRVMGFYDVANRGFRIASDILYGISVLRPESSCAIIR